MNLQLFALPTATKVLGINDAKISKLTADPAGGSATYSAAVDVPGIQSLSLSPKFVEKDLRGDEQILDRYTRLESVEFSWANAKLSLDVLAIILGGTVTTSGATPNQTQKYALKATDLPNYFKLEGQAVYSDAGDVHVVFYKCKVSKVDYELKTEDYAIVSVSGVAIPRESDQLLKDIVMNETKTNIV